MCPALATLPTANHGSLPSFPGSGGSNLPPERMDDDQPSPPPLMMFGSTSTPTPTSTASLPLHHAKSRFRVYHRPSSQLVLPLTSAPSAALPHQLPTAAAAAAASESGWTRHERSRRCGVVLVNPHPVRCGPRDDQFSPPPSASDDEVRDLLDRGGAAAAARCWLRSPGSPLCGDEGIGVRQPRPMHVVDDDEEGGASTVILTRDGNDDSRGGGGRRRGTRATSSGVGRVLDEAKRSQAAVMAALMVAMILPHPAVVRRPSLDFYKMQV